MFVARQELSEECYDGLEMKFYIIISWYTARCGEPETAVKSVTPYFCLQLVITSG